MIYCISINGLLKWHAFTEMIVLSSSTLQCIHTHTYYVYVWAVMILVQHVQILKYNLYDDSIYIT